MRHLIVFGIMFGFGLVSISFHLILLVITLFSFCIWRVCRDLHIFSLRLYCLPVFGFCRRSEITVFLKIWLQTHQLSSKRSSSIPFCGWNQNRWHLYILSMNGGNTLFCVWVSTWNYFCFGCLMVPLLFRHQWLCKLVRCCHLCTPCAGWFALLLIHFNLACSIKKNNYTLKVWYFLINRSNFF